MIPKASKEVTLIVYNTPKPPRVIKVNTALIKSLLIIIPFLFIVSIGISFTYSIFLKTQLNAITSQEPQVITELKEVLKIKTNLVTNLKRTNQSLIAKLAKGADDTPNSNFQFLTPPVGFQDLREAAQAKISNIQLDTKNGISTLKFDLTNNQPQLGKISGYITVIQFQDNLMQYYPNYSLSDKTLRLEYAKGESFTASRFRPVFATFKKVTNISARYKIYIFSRTGDLLIFQQVGPFNIE